MFLIKSKQVDEAGKRPENTPFGQGTVTKPLPVFPLFRLDKRYLNVICKPLIGIRLFIVILALYRQTYIKIFDF
ncbi:hypothetical protein [Dysgonomonas reticulitermitis]